MSDIDMQSYAGAKSSPAAVDQQVVDTNSYNQEDEYPVNTALLDTPKENIEAPEALSAQPDNFKALREEVDRIKAERETEKREHQLQLDMLRANLNQQTQANQQPFQERKFMDGMNDEDVPNVGEIRREWAQKEAVYQERLEELMTIQRNPDYAEVLEKYVVPLVRNKPHLAEGIQGARNKSLFAYELGKMAQQAHQHQEQRQIEPVTNSNAQRIVDNSRKPGTLSQAGGTGALSKADYYASMSDAEFMRMANQNLDGI
jgi:hypothetical protein